MSGNGNPVYDIAVNQWELKHLILKSISEAEGFITLCKKSKMQSTCFRRHIKTSIASLERALEHHAMMCPDLAKMDEQ